MRISDWSSDVCSSDLVAKLRKEAARLGANGVLFRGTADGYGSGGVSVGAGGGRVGGSSFSGGGIGVNISPRQKYARGQVQIAHLGIGMGEDDPRLIRRGDALGIPAVHKIGAGQLTRLGRLHHAMRLIGMRSDERRVGKEGVSTWRSRWSPYH